MKKPVLSKTSATLVSAFGEAAKHHGWQEDCGTVKSAADAKADFDQTKAALEKRILSLEVSLRKARTVNARRPKSKDTF